ncbi:MAG: flagellar hook-basal body complex protein FliE [Planctomycetota bacterium]
MADPLGLIGTGGARPLAPTPPSAPGGQPSTRFKDVLLDNIEQVNQLQRQAEGAIEDLMTGRRDDADAVFTAKQKADIAFQTLLQVRNKMMDAYEEVKQIRV